MSSRNMRLNENERIKARAIYQALQAIKDQLQKGELATIKNLAVNILVEKGFKVDYVEIAGAGNLQIVEKWDGKQNLVALAAVYLNQVRLIDNILVNGY